MKRLIVITLVIICSLTFLDCFAKKPTKQIVDSQQTYLDSLKMVEGLQQIEAEMRLEKEKYEAKKAALEKLNQSFMEEIEIIEMPCQEEAKSNDEYYAAWAVSDGQPNQNFAVQDAMSKAQRELAKQIGREEVVLEGVEIICREISRDRYGSFIAYVAVRMPKKQ